jgi:cell fate (sporulation/competence/biofilm development) regulator YlbF (YheA/YmcA/DUF963 family)
MISLETKQSPVIEKTRELCEVLLTQESFKKIKQDIDAFSEDEAAREQYNELCDIQDMLQEKDEQGLTLSEEEIADYDAKRDALLANPVAAAFIDAQQQLHKLQETVSQYISKTFKLGRVPEESDFEKGKCGPRCGCGG